ncbi:DM13 domain-containing protein [Candidatus Kaiserbacteria bacterium]|nr:DM13 domain-containing protein [Candidatus Kaiserbacteria bacterium]
MKKIIGIVIIVIVLGIGYYTISPFFRNVSLDETAPESTEVQSAEIIDTPTHPASGTVRIIEGVDGETIIRYENFKTINGPNLHVYLAKDLDAKEFVDLGPIRGTEGNINYVVPEDIDITEYSYVMYWCVPFSVLFNYAEI